MKILIMDRDRLTTQLLTSKLEADHAVVVEPVKKNAMSLLENEHFDMVMMDPAPMPSAKPMAMQLRWKKNEHYTYLLLLTHEAKIEDVVRAGMNDFLLKPFDPEQLREKITNAHWLIEFNNQLKQEPDIRTYRDVFGKRPFIQLLLSALDRAFRYSEKAFLIFIQLQNYSEIAQQHNAAQADKITHMIADYLSDLRRMSDFLARTNEHEFVILMQRPWNEAEPRDAAERFILAMAEFNTKHDLGSIIPKFKIKLVELPTSKTLIEQDF